MNLLHLIIIIPLLSFLFLSLTHKKLPKLSLSIIGVSALFFVSIIVTFIYIDYANNAFSDTSLVYTRELWQWFSFDSNDVFISLQFDELTLFFLTVITFISLLIYFFAIFYFTNKHDLYLFFANGNLLIASLFLFILADNLLILFIAAEVVSFCSFLLINNFYKKHQVNLSAIKAFIIMIIADYFLLFGIFLIYSELHSINIRDIIDLTRENIATDSHIISLITFAFFIACAGKAGLFPFHSAFTQTTKTQMPVMMLLQSVSFIVCSSYLIMRFSPLFTLSNDVFKLIGILASITIIFSACISLVKHDIKSIITYINLLQMSFLFCAFVSRQWALLPSYIIIYSVMSCLLIMSSGILIQLCNKEQNIHHFSALIPRYPLLFCLFVFILMSMGFIPFLFSSYFIKGELLSALIDQKEFGLTFIYIIGLIFSILSLFRMMTHIFRNKSKITHFDEINHFVYIPIIILMILATFISQFFSFPIIHILQNDGKANYQSYLFLITLPITLCAFILSNLFFRKKTRFVQKIKNAEIARIINRFWYHEWYFDHLLMLIFVMPYKYLTSLITKDPIAKWDKTLINKGINTYTLAQETAKKQLSHYKYPMMTGIFILVIFLIFI